MGGGAPLRFLRSSHVDTSELSLRVSQWTTNLIAVLRKDGSCGGGVEGHAATERHELGISPFMLLVLLVAPFVLQRAFAVLKET
jgi:hypothetical protein